jgi:predicted porin
VVDGLGVDQSRFGLRGSEDLGGGLKAIFTLESGFGIGNGKLSNNGGMFNRQAFVGLSSQYGTVTLGRQYDSVQDYLAPLTATGTWGGTYFAHPGNVDRLSTNGDVALNNSVKFTSANYAGLQFGGTYSFSNNQNFGNNRAYSGGLSYQFQGLKLGGAYCKQTWVTVPTATARRTSLRKAVSARTVQLLATHSARHKSAQLDAIACGQHRSCWPIGPRRQLRSQRKVQPDAGSGSGCCLHVHERSPVEHG